MAGVLDGIRIIDWTQWQMGPVSTAMMAELGADVIKIEARLVGDHGRYLKVGDLPPLADGRNPYFETNNRGKRSLTLDLSKPKGRDILYKLVSKSDVFVHNFRQGVPEKLKMDYETLVRHNPKLIYVAASGFGHKGLESKEPAFDMVGLARSGVSSLFSYEDNPNLPFHGGMADQAGALITAYGILAAVLARERHGIGQKVDVSHLGSMLALQGLNIGMSWLCYPDGPPLPRPAKLTRKNTGNPLWNYYMCKDGRWLCLGMLQPDVKWAVVCKALGLEYLQNDPRYIDQDVRRANSASLIAVMDEIFVTKTADEWMKHLKATGDIICTPVQTQADLQFDPQVIANDYLVELPHDTFGKVKVRNCPIEMSGTPAHIKPESPMLGQHTEEVLSEVLGYSWEEISKLKEAEVV